MEEEIWRDVVGYEGFYLVSNLGNVKSLAKEVLNGKAKFVRNGKILKPYLNKDGYPTVNLYLGSKKKLLNIHRIVALAFIENLEKKPTINHKNSIRYDNRVENLEWATYSENNKHAHDFGFKKPNKGEKCWIYDIDPDNHPSAKEVIDTSTGKIYGSLKSACLDLGIKYSTMLSKIYINAKGKNDTNLMFLSDLKELPNKVIIKIGNREFSFKSELQSDWIRIEEDGSNLPKKRMESWVLDKNGRIEMFIFGKQFNYGKDSELEYVLRHFTHYQPITKPLPPLY